MTKTECQNLLRRTAQKVHDAGYDLVYEYEPFIMANSALNVKVKIELTQIIRSRLTILVPNGNESAGRPDGSLNDEC